MIRAFHVTISCYGHWLPNDPRGSYSRFVGSHELFEVGGAATTVHTRVSVAHKPHDQDLRLRTKAKLKYPPVLFTSEQIEAVTSTLRSLSDIPLITYKVSTDHTHLLIGPTQIDINEIVLQIKEEAVKTLLERGIHPRAYLAGTPAYPDPLHVAASVWSRGCWKVFIYSDDHLKQAIRYIEKHK